MKFHQFEIFFFGALQRKFEMYPSFWMMLLVTFFWGPIFSKTRGHLFPKKMKHQPWDEQFNGNRLDGAARMAKRKGITVEARRFFFHQKIHHKNSGVDYPFLGGSNLMQINGDFEGFPLQ